MWFNAYALYQQPVWMVSVFLLIAIWEMIWKGLGLWHSAKNQQKGWFIAILVLNTLGLLPIIYLLWFKPKEKEEQEVKGGVGKALKKKARRKK